MTTLSETTHPGGFLVWEAFRDYTREVVTVAAHDPGATDGTETADAVLWRKADASSGDVDAVALIRGPAIVNRHDPVFAGSPTQPEIDAAHTAFLAAGILVR